MYVELVTPILQSPRCNRPPFHCLIDDNLSNIVARFLPLNLLFSAVVKSSEDGFWNF